MNFLIALLARRRFRLRVRSLIALVAADAARLRRLVRTDRARADPAPRLAHRLGLRRRPILHRPQLDRDRLHLPGGDAGVARLGRGGAAVASTSPSIRCSPSGLAWQIRARAAPRPGARARRRLGDLRMAARARCSPASPGTRSASRWSTRRGARLAADRHLRPVAAGRARRRHAVAGCRSARVARAAGVAALGRCCSCARAAPRAAPRGSAASAGHRPQSASSSPTSARQDKWREGFRRVAGAAPRPACRSARSIAPGRRADLLARGGGDRSAQRRARRAPRRSSTPSARARSRTLGPGDCC